VHHIIQRLERTTVELHERTLALRRSEEEFRALFDHVFEGVFRAAPDGSLLMANRALVDMLGYASPEELRHVDLSRDVYVGDADRRRYGGASAMTASSGTPRFRSSARRQRALRPGQRAPRFATPPRSRV